MRALLLILGMLLALFPSHSDVNVVVIPPMPAMSPAEVEEIEWYEFRSDAYEEHVEAFDALFNSYETKWSKNNRLMIRSGNSGSYRFVAKA